MNKLSEGGPLVLPIFIILIVILVLDQLINRSLIKRENIEVNDQETKYVNMWHKYGEKITYWVTFILMIISINDLHHLRFIIFLGPAILFAFRTFMEWNFARQNKTYLLSTVTFVLFIIGSIVYGSLLYYNAVY